jgi:hypothetical protein
MKHIIERFFCMTTEDVLDSFAALPNAEVHKSFIFIPGTRERKLLLVGHADTVFTRPPRSIEWYGSFAKTSYADKKFPSGPFLPTKAKKIETPSATPAITSEDGAVAPALAIVPEADLTKLAEEAAAQEPSGEQAKIVDAVQESSKKNKKKKKGQSTLEKKKVFDWDKSLNAGYVTVDGKRMTIPEYRKLCQEEKENSEKDEKKPQTSSTTNTPKNDSNRNYGNWNGSHHYGGGYREGGLGADDRAGIAVLWLLRNSGHSILVTDGEESGGIGAKAAAKFMPERIHEHQFAVEVDRQMDQEMVFYDVSTKEFEKWMEEKSGFVTRMGSYTDIKDVCSAGGICGVNLAAGYWGQHSASEMFCYDAWLRSFNFVRKLCNMEDLPKFELPPRKSYNHHSSHVETTRVPTTTPSTLIGPDLNGKSSTEATTPRRPLEAVKAENKAMYKDGPRFPETTTATTPTGIGIIRTTIDPKTRQKKVERETVENATVTGETDLLFPEGSAPIETALDDLLRRTEHASATDDGMAVEKSGEGQLDLVNLHHQNAPVM